MPTPPSASPAVLRPRYSAPNEATLEAFFRKQVRLSGGLAFKIAPTTKGIPDRLILMPGGRQYLVELKTDRGALSPAQHVWHARAAEVGTYVHVLHGKGDILSWLRAVTETSGPPPDSKTAPRWVACSERGNPRAAAERHLVADKSSTTRCGITLDNPIRWRRDSTRPLCPTCQRWAYPGTV